MKLEFFVRDLRMTRKGLEPLVGDTSGYYTFTIAFDRAWDGLVKVVVFQNGDQTAQMIYKGESRLPPQVSGAGELYVACHGYRREGDQVAVLRTLRMVKPVRLRPSGPMEGDTAQIGTPSLYAQVMGAVGQAEAIRQELIEARDSGAFIGPPGQPGKDAEVPEKLPNPYPLSLTINGVEVEYDGSEAVVAQVRLNETNWGTAIMKRLQEHDQSGEANPDIREAIPERLPNPHPLSLTINGVEVEYDGSEAVAAQIAGAVNAGGGDTWELIGSAEVTEAVTSIVLSEDLDGEPLALKAIAIYAPLGVTASSKGQLRVYLTAGDSYMGFSGANGDLSETQSKSFWIEFASFGEYWRKLYEASTYNVAGVSAGVTGLTVRHSSGQPVTEIKIAPQYGTFTAGTFYIYGVRA